MENITGESPIHHLIDSLGPQWGYVGRTPVALHFGDPGAESEFSRTLGLCDVSAWPKFGVKGKNAARWLIERYIDVPDDIYDVRTLGNDGIIARIGPNEFLLEDGTTGTAVAALSEQLESAEGRVYRVERQEATFLLSGAKALEPVAQVCGVDLSKLLVRRLIYTRFAGVSVGVISAPVKGLPVYRIWVDSTYAEYLWENLSQISGELGGRIVGVGCLNRE